jgi:hypothetical protein
MGWRAGWRTVVTAALASGCGAGGAEMTSHTSTPPVTPGADAAAALADAQADAGAGAPDASGGAATWTRIYTTLLVSPSYASSCLGAACHDPGREHGIDLSTSDAGYRTLQVRIVPGMPQSSDLVSVLQSGFMPEGRPRMPAADVDLVRAWIAAGAPED